MAIIRGRLDSERSYVKLFPRNIKTLRHADIERGRLEGKLREKSLGRWTGVRKWHISKKLKKFNTKKARSLYYGTIGERKALDVLRMLSNDYHVFCGIKIRFKNYMEYQGKTNLRSAQIDLAVVGPTGIFAVEVKNWSDKYVSMYSGLSPCEQADRASIILGKRLKLDANALVTSVRNNIKYDQSYDAKVVNIEELANVIDGGNIILTEKQVLKAVKILCRYDKR